VEGERERERERDRQTEDLQYCVTLSEVFKHNISLTVSVLLHTLHNHSTFHNTLHNTLPTDIYASRTHTHTHTEAEMKITYSYLHTHTHNIVDLLLEKLKKLKNLNLFLIINPRIPLRYVSLCYHTQANQIINSNITQ